MKASCADVMQRDIFHCSTLSAFICSRPPQGQRMELSTINKTTEHSEPVMKTEKGKSAIWVTVEVIEVIELKRIVLDRDAAGAVEFFQAVIAPQVIVAAERFGIHRAGVEETDDGRLPG